MADFIEYLDEFPTVLLNIIKEYINESTLRLITNDPKYKFNMNELLDNNPEYLYSAIKYDHNYNKDTIIYECIKRGIYKETLELVQYFNYNPKIAFKCTLMSNSVKLMEYFYKPEYKTIFSTNASRFDCSFAGLKWLYEKKYITARDACGIIMELYDLSEIDKCLIWLADLDGIDYSKRNLYLWEYALNSYAKMEFLHKHNAYWNENIYIYNLNKKIDNDTLFRKSEFKYCDSTINIYNWLYNHGMISKNHRYFDFKADGVLEFAVDKKLLSLEHEVRALSLPLELEPRMIPEPLTRYYIDYFADNNFKNLHCLWKYVKTIDNIIYLIEKDIKSEGYISLIGIEDPEAIRYLVENKLGSMIDGKNSIHIEEALGKPLAIDDVVQENRNEYNDNKTGYYRFDLCGELLKYIDGSPCTPRKFDHKKMTLYYEQNRFYRIYMTWDVELDTKSMQKIVKSGNTEIINWLCDNGAIRVDEYNYGRRSWLDNIFMDVDLNDTEYVLFLMQKFDYNPLEYLTSCTLSGYHITNKILQLYIGLLDPERITCCLIDKLLRFNFKVAEYAIDIIAKNKLFDFSLFKEGLIEARKESRDLDPLEHEVRAFPLDFGKNPVKSNKLHPIELNWLHKKFNLIQ